MSHHLLSAGAKRMNCWRRHGSPFLSSLFVLGWEGRHATYMWPQLARIILPFLRTQRLHSTPEAQSRKRIEVPLTSIHGVCNLCNLKIVETARLKPLVGMEAAPGGKHTSRCPGSL